MKLKHRHDLFEFLFFRTVERHDHANGVLILQQHVPDHGRKAHSIVEH
jgi:hypothetical protein